ncbi:hypothetical protein ACFWPK_34130 [Nocardia sp. NPDC058519]|uniref:hypothetical protein n=1 Tax=Nocardia sp. NPDC058519 TaxID=3346535 RepID=UPI003654B815
MSDVGVREAFRQLVLHAELDEASIISTHITERSPRPSKLMTNMYRNLDVVEGAPSATSAAASDWVTRPVAGVHRMDLYYGWGTGESTSTTS